MTEKSFINWLSYSDKALTRQIGLFIRHQRMEQNRTQEELAKSAGISRSTLSLLERGETVSLMTLIQVLRVLDQLGVMDFFVVKDEPSPLAMVKAQKSIRKRAGRRSDKKQNENIVNDW